MPLRTLHWGFHLPTLLTELIPANSLDTTGDEVLQPKGPLNFKAMIHIQQAEGGNSGAYASSLGVGSS